MFATAVGLDCSDRTQDCYGRCWAHSCMPLNPRPRTSPATCSASQVTWMTDEGLKALSDVRCSAIGQPFHQAIEGDFPTGCTGSLCIKHASLYHTKRSVDKCGVVRCFKQGAKFQSGVRWCREHVPGSGEAEPASAKRSRSRTRAKARTEEVEPEDADEENEAEEPGTFRGTWRGLKC